MLSRLKKRTSVVVVLPGSLQKCSSFPGRRKGEKEKEMEGKGKEGTEKRRERIRDRIRQYIGKEEGIV